MQEVGNVSVHRYCSLLKKLFLTYEIAIFLSTFNGLGKWLIKRTVTLFLFSLKENRVYCIISDLTHSFEIKSGVLNPFESIIYNIEILYIGICIPVQSIYTNIC